MQHKRKQIIKGINDQYRMIIPLLINTVIASYILSDLSGHCESSLVPDPAFTLDKDLAHFARNLGLADSALPEVWRTNQIAYTC